jgi:hypothetical protein
VAVSDLVRMALQPADNGFASLIVTDCLALFAEFR